MQSSTYNTQPNDFRSSYQRYKALSNTFIAWLLSTYEGLNSSDGASHRTAKSLGSKTTQSFPKQTVTDLEHFAEFIVKCPRYGVDRVPRSILNCLYKIIQRRSEAHIYYLRRLDSDVSSNQTHAHFIGVLEKMFDTLGGEAWIQDHLSARPKRTHKMNQPISPLCDPSPPPNRFFAFSPHIEGPTSLSDDEDDEPQANSRMQDQSSSSDSKPGKGHSRRASATSRQSRKRFRSVFPDFSLGEDSDDMFTQFCFFDDLNMLRKHVRCIWSEWAVEPTLKGLVVAATATDVAVRVAEDLEMRFLGHDPTLTDMDSELARQALLSFDGMVRASDDWTIGLMSPYYTAISETRSNPGGSMAVSSATASRWPFAEVDGAPKPDARQELAVALRHPVESNEYWNAFMSRMTGELGASSHHSLLNAGESSLNQLIRGSSSISDPYLPEGDEGLPRLRAVTEIVDDTKVEEINSMEEGAAAKEQEPTIIRQRTTPKPCLVFAAQVYLDIDQITLDVEFPYQHAISHLGKKIYTYMNWLSCQSLKKHIKTLTLTPSMEILPIMDEMPPVKERRPYASMSLAPRGVWQDGMGDFGRLVGVKISQDVGAELNRGAIAIMNPNQDVILSPWSWGSRAMHILAESLRFGAKAYNEGGMFIAIAHIYNALREMRYSMPAWRHMDSYLAIHGDDIFNGSRPTRQQAERSSSEFFYNRWRLRMGLPAREFSKGKRTGQFTKRGRNAASCSNYGMRGCQVTNPDTSGPALMLRRPKQSANRNTDGISKEVLAIRLVEKRMHLDAEALKLLTGSTLRSHSVDLGYLVTATKERLDEDMAKMSRNLFAMEAYCQRVIERVINSVPREMLDGFLESCGLVTNSSETSRWEIRENLPVFAALVLLLLDSYHPLESAWVQAFEAIAEEDEDAGFVLIHEEAVLVSAQPGHVEEVAE